MSASQLGSPDRAEPEVSRNGLIWRLMTLGFRRLSNPLYRNAFLLILTSVFGGLFSFIFWLIVVRYCDSDAVGLSASLLALAGFLGSLSSLGLGIGLIRFLPTISAGKNQRINMSPALTALTALGVSLVFLSGLDLWSPAVTFVRTSWSYTVMFLAFTVGFALTPLVESSFLGG